MDNMTKLGLGIGALAAAAFTGAAINAAHAERDRREEELRKDVMDLESKVREQGYQAQRTERNIDSANERISELNRQFGKHLTQHAVETSAEKKA